MNRYYFIDQNGRQTGPVEANELPKYGVKRNTMVWCQGMADWQPVFAVAELVPFFPPVSPQAGLGNTGNQFQSTPQPPSMGNVPPYTNSTNSQSPYSRPIYAPGYQENGAPGNPPNNYLWLSILTTLLCCLPLGIVGIIYSTQVMSKWNSGDFAGAEASARNAKTWSLVGIGLGLATSVLYGISLVFLGY